MCQDLVDKQRKKVHIKISISMFFVETHLDVVLEVLLMVGLDFLFSKLVDKYHRYS